MLQFDPTFNQTNQSKTYEAIITAVGLEWDFGVVWGLRRGMVVFRRALRPPMHPRGAAPG